MMRDIYYSEWEVNPEVGRGETWRKEISELFLQLNLDSQGILAEEYSVNLFLVHLIILQEQALIWGVRIGTGVISLFVTWALNC